MPYPQSHIDEAHKLVADAPVKLYKITLSTGAIIRIKNNNTVTWQGNVYEGVPMALSGVSFSAGDEANRPKVMVANPDGIYSSLVRTKVFERGTLLQYEVLKQHLDTNQNIFNSRTWRIARALEVNLHVISLELRNLTDGPMAKIPSRFFTQPEFPSVTFQ